MARRLSERLEDILQAISDVEAFTTGMTEAAFLTSSNNNRLIYMAVLAAFMQMGEAIKALPDNAKARHEAVEWRSIAGLRDFLAHHYDRTETQILWEVLSSPKLRELRAAVEAELRGLPP
jgi:uncharacterized protein with HEPN domain